MSQLEEDIKKLGKEAITKGDIKAAFKIMGCAKWLHGIVD